jgi:hypothetical protein
MNAPKGKEGLIGTVFITNVMLTLGAYIVTLHLLQCMVSFFFHNHA